MKILIVLDNIHTGGISKSLLNLLPHIVQYADCDLLVFKKTGIENYPIPSNITIVETDTKLNLLGMSQNEIKDYSKFGYCCRATLVLLSRIFSGDFSRKILFSFVKNIGEYDLAISYSQDVGWNTISTGCNQFVLEKVRAKAKVAFIHCDYEQFGGYSPKQEKTYHKFDKIVCVSKSCKNSFIRKFPKLEEKCYVCENFTNIEEISVKTKSGNVEYDMSEMNFVTVCRLGEEKGLIRTIQVLDKLKKEGYKKFHWTIVGDGPDKKKIERLINEFELNKVISLVGQKSNPYVYIKNADFFLLPSFHEAAPMVFGESIALGIPVVTTNTISAKELIEDRGYGVVCENSSEGIYSVLKDIFDGKIKLKIIKKINTDINKFADKELRTLISLFERG